MLEKYVMTKLLVSIAGGTGGALAMAVLKPKTLLEAFLRGWVGIATPLFITDPVIRWLDLPADTETVVFVAFVTGFVSWFALGAVARTLEHWRQKGLLVAIDEIRGRRK